MPCGNSKSRRPLHLSCGESLESLKFWAFSCSLGRKGDWGRRPPFATWKRKLNPQYLLSKVKGQPDQEKKPELGDLLEASLKLVKTYVALYACLPFPATGQREDLIRFLRRTIQLSSKHFLRDFHQEEGKRERKQVRDFVAKLAPTVSSLERRIREKSEAFLTEEAERERRASLNRKIGWRTEGVRRCDCFRVMVMLMQLSCATYNKVIFLWFMLFIFQCSAFLVDIIDFHFGISHPDLSSSTSFSFVL